MGPHAVPLGAHELVEEDLEGTPGDLGGVERLQAPGRRVSRVHERLLAFLHAVPVQALEPALLHVDLAAHLDLVGRVISPQAERDRADRAEVGGDVVALLAVAPRQAQGESAPLVAERDRDAVDLRLHGVVDDLLAQPLPDAGIELSQLLEGIGVVEAQHRRGVTDRGEAGQEALGNPRGRRIGVGELRMFLLELLELAHRRVELLVGDLGLAQDVIEVVVPLDLLSKRSDSFGDAWAHQLLAYLTWIVASRSAAPGARPSSSPAKPEAIRVLSPAP